MGTHFLETAEGGNLSGNRMEATKQRAPTNWRPQKEGLVRAQKEINRVTGTHSLETTEGGACQDMERR